MPKRLSGGSGLVVIYSLFSIDDLGRGRGRVVEEAGDDEEEEI